MTLFKKYTGNNWKELHLTWSWVLYFIYFMGTTSSLLVCLASLISICIRPAVQPEIIRTASGLRFDLLTGYAQLRQETLPLTTDVSSINGKLFAVTFLVLSLAAYHLPSFFIAWKGCRILHTLKHSHSPFVPEIAEHICWIGRISLFIGLFGKLIIQVGMSVVIDHRIHFDNPYEMPWLLAGVILLLVSDIFKKGCILQKEADETL